MNRWHAFVALVALVLLTAGAAPRRAGMRYALAPPPRAEVIDSLFCITSSATPVQVLGWLAIHGLLAPEPFPKLFAEPPLTGPRPGVDTTRYVALWRQLCELPDGVVVDIPESVAVHYRPFRAWSDSEKTVFVASTWRRSLFPPPDSIPPVDSLPPPPPPPPAGGLLAATDFHNLGAFRVPAGSVPNTTAWGGGAASCFTARGTVLVSGFQWNDTSRQGGRVAELAPPAPRIGGPLSTLPMATIVTDWRDVTGGQYATFTDGEQHRVGGLWELPGAKSVLAGFDGYGADGRDLRTLFVLGSPYAWHVGPKSVDGTFSPTSYWRSTGGFCAIPSWFSAAHCPGLDLGCTGGRRLGGGTYGSPMGPSLLATSSSGWPAGGGDLPYKTLLDYPRGHPVDGYSVCARPVGDMCSTDRFLGVAWIDSTVVFLAQKCTGTSHYDDNGGEGFCQPSNKGQVCDAPYSAQLWCYSARDLGRVADGLVPPWTIEPYLILSLDAWLPVPRCEVGVAGLAWDEVHRVLLYWEQGADASQGQYDLPALGCEVAVDR